MRKLIIASLALSMLALVGVSAQAAKRYPVTGNVYSNSSANSDGGSTTFNSDQ